jgi:hypothetical protein
MNIYEDENYEIKMNRITDQLGHLILDLLYMGLQKLTTENEIYQEFLETRLEMRRETPARQAQADKDDKF